MREEDVLSAPSTMTQGVGVSCDQCGRVFTNARGARIHRTLVHGDGPIHGTLTKYRHGCRCDECKEANRLQKRKDRYPSNPRPIDGSPETLEACLLAFGVAELSLRRALKTSTIQDLHWALYLSKEHGGAFRDFCRCQEPGWVVDEIERAS